MHPRCLLIAAVLALPAFTPESQAGSPPVRRSVVVDVVQSVRDAVVNIHSERTAQATGIEEMFTTPSQSRSHGLGTGIIIDHRGYIITNQHVVEDVSVIRVRLGDESTYRARIVARDRDRDLALLKIDAGRRLPTVPLGTSDDLMVGETVIAIGNAFGYEHSVTTGVISQLNRDVTLNKDIAYKSLIQTDACINPGNSGGPLLNIEGKLIGVNVAIRAGAQGIGFAIPVNQMVDVAGKLLAESRKTNLWHGISYRDRVHLGTTDRLLEVSNIASSSPAFEAGLRSGDVLVQADELDIDSSIDFQRALLDRHPGEALALKIRRGGDEQVVDLVLQGSPQIAATPVDQSWRLLGLRLAPTKAKIYSPSRALLNGGMIVMEIAPNSPAEIAGLQRGDILIGLHVWEAVKMDDVAYALNYAQTNGVNPLKYYLIRAGEVHEGVISFRGRSTASGLRN